MLSYLATFVNQDGAAFPDTEAINASGPSTTDGTEFIANMINDSMWGVMQMLLNYAGLTPTGVVESDSVSQIKEALQKGFGSPPGTVTHWHRAVDPGISGFRCLELKGQGILRANFPDLDAACYVGDANNAAVAASAGGGYFRSDDEPGTIPNIAGIYLKLPDTRGMVPRGADPSAIKDPDGASRFLGDRQVDAAQGHHHDINQSVPLLTGALADGAGVSLYTLNSSFAPTATSMITNGIHGVPRLATETRGYNFQSKFVIWY